MSTGSIRTPMLDQFRAIKKKYPDAILFYRMGDFYEMFFDDAVIASEVLGLRLTSRAHGNASQKVPLAGFPHHQIDSYLTRMVKAGKKVVIVEQVEDPKKAKGLVKRDVVQIATAGTNPASVDQETPRANRIAALIKGVKKWGLAWADIATGEFVAGEFDRDQLIQVASQVSPVELLTPEGRSESGTSLFKDNVPPVFSKIEEWIWESSFARQTLLEHFSTRGLKGFGLDHLELAISAAGALLHYLKGNLRSEITHLTSLSRADVSGYMVLEATSRRNLELFDSLSGNQHATLFSVIDRTITGSGRRLLYNRMMTPLANPERLEERLDGVEEFVNSPELLKQVRAILKQTGDLQRYLARLATGRGSARDLVGIRETLKLVPEVRVVLNSAESAVLQALCGRMDGLGSLVELMDLSLVDEPPVSTSDGGMIREGYNAELDELRAIKSDNKSWLKNYEKQERERTDIPNLKINYNRVFGYYIEITNSYKDKTPEDYMRRQTLVNAERFITDKLKGFEEKLLGAEERIIAIERELIGEVVSETLTKSVQLQENALAFAEMDFLAGLATIAIEENYTRPELTLGDQIYLKGSRHPVVEKLLPPGEDFISNNLDIGGENKRIHIITGPNMAGKSTYLRQVALVVIMAQMGSFVPAQEARIGVVDKLFTRIGALDNLAGGESTFLVEMQETASILHNTTSRSLVLFDEVGRGTSTFDGLSLAWSIVEYLHADRSRCPRTLFATHYHELVDLEKHLPMVGNWNVAVREYEDSVIFLRKIIPGGCDRSFGIHVARMAGLPVEIIKRANEVLKNLEANDLNPVDSDEPGKPSVNANVRPSRQIPRAQVAQLNFFDSMERKVREILKDINPETTTPLQALNILSELKQLFK